MGNESAAEKTESATPRRREKERERGNISKSRDLAAALVMTVSVALLALMGKFILDRMLDLLRYTFTNIHPDTVCTDNIMGILAPYLQACAGVVLPFLLTLALAALIIVRLNIGHVFAMEKVKFDFNNISPRRVLENAKRLFNPFEPRSMVEFVKSLIKIAVVGSCGYATANSRKDELFAILGADPATALGVICSILIKMLINMCIAMIILGLLDKKYQDWEYEKSIKMTKQEIKDEYKDIEGDPKIKSKIKSIQIQMSKQRMMSNVPKADVVVTNPTHYAVAIKYDKTVAPAPIVIAKGIDYVAFRIREIAKNNDIPIVENRPVARALYNTVPVDGIIPSDLYVAVAEILAYVYNKKGK